MPVIMDTAATARPVAIDDFTDPFEQLSDTDIFIQATSGPIYMEDNIWLKSASTREVQHDSSEPVLWSEPSPTAPQSFCPQSSDPVNHSIHGDILEPLFDSKSILDSATRKTDDQIRSAEPTSFLSYKNTHQSVNKLHILPSDLGSPEDQTYQQYPDTKSKYGASNAQLFAPSTSQSTSDNRSSSNALRRRKSHNEIEKRYRSSLNNRFLKLQNVLEDSHILGNKVDVATQNAKRASKISVLEQARAEIFALREQVGTLEGKLGSLRKLAFPATCKYTLRNSRD